MRDQGRSCELCSRWNASPFENMPKNRKVKKEESEPQTMPESTPELVVVNGATLVLEPTPTVTPMPSVTELESEGTTLRSLPGLLTFEVLVYVLIGLVALLLRISGVQARPLAPFEAQTAAAAWEFLNGQAPGAYSSPLLFTVDWFSFVLFGASDWTARIFPAVLATLLVYIPLMARGTLGKLGAALAAGLIAISPTMVFFARTLSGVELAAGAALAALLFFYRFRHGYSTRNLYAAAFLAAVSLTADAVALTVLIAGSIFLAYDYVSHRRATDEGEAANVEDETPIQQRPVLRAAIVFVATYVLIATTFLLNRDGLGVAFNVVGDWFASFASIGDFVSPLNWLLVYEPLALIFGLAGLVLVFTLRGGHEFENGMLRLFAVVTLFAFLFYTIAGNISPGITVAITLPLILLAAWFIGNLLERARDDIEAGGGTQSMPAGEIPIFAMMLVLAALVYVQVVTFLQNTSFSPALDGLYDLLGGSSPEASLMVAGATLGIISLLLLGVFVGLSILLIGTARTTTLLAIVVLVLLGLGMVRATWQLAFPPYEPVRELLLREQTPQQVDDMLSDIEFMSRSRYGDPNVIRIAADPALGAVARWYLRVFPNVMWTTDPATTSNAQAILTLNNVPPTGDWMSQRYQFAASWEPTNLDGVALWKWFVFREGGSPSAQTVLLWLPTIEE